MIAFRPARIAQFSAASRSHHSVLRCLTLAYAVCDPSTEGFLRSAPPRGREMASLCCVNRPSFATPGSYLECRVPGRPCSGMSLPVGLVA